MSVNSKMKAIADELRTLGETSAPLNLDAMALSAKNANDAITEDGALLLHIKNVLENKAAGSAALPYTRIHYIESTGVECIDTGYIVQETDAIEMDYEILSFSGMDRMLFGASSSGGIWAENYGNSKNWYVRFGGLASNIINWNLSQTRGTIRVEKGKATINSGSTIALDPVDSLPDVSLIIFGRRNIDGTLQHFTVMKCYGFRIIDGDGALKMNLIPCIYNGEAGMWDTITNTFFGNATGEGAFIASAY